MPELNPLYTRIKDMQGRLEALRGYSDFETKSERLIEVSRELEVPELWNEPERAQAIGRERAELETVVNTLNNLDSGLVEATELLELAEVDDDEDTIAAVTDDLEKHEGALATLEFRRMFSGEMDGSDAYLDIQSGSGGTEAQDWAEMLRMYLRWGERRGFKAELIEASPGDVAGIKRNYPLQGDHAYGWLRTESGVHRLVRKSL